MTNNTNSSNPFDIFIETLKERARQEIILIRDGLRALATEYINFVEMLPDITLFIKELYKEYIKLDKDLEEIYPIFVDAKMWVTINMLTNIGFIQGLRELKEDESINPQKLINFIIEGSRYDNYKMIKDMIEIWKKDQIFLEREPMINDALFAHENGRYNLSIIILVSLCEGIASKITNINAKKGKIAILAIIESRTFFMKNVLRTALVKFIKDVLYKSIDFDNYNDELAKQNIHENDFLNRHAIMHGVNIGFASEVNSLRMFMLLDSISSIKYIPKIDQ